MRLERNDAKKKNINYKQFELFDRTDGETKNVFKQIKTRKKEEESKLAALPKCLHSKNDFKKAIKLTENIRASTNNVKSGSDDKKGFDDLDKLINDIKKKKQQDKGALKNK